MLPGTFQRKISRRLIRPFLRTVSRFGGKIRRAYLCLARPGSVEKALELRQGSCNHCGKCCQISFSCPFLKVYGSHSICKIYHIGRPAPCSAFPINRADLADVDFECSFTFLEERPARSPSGSPGLPVWNTRSPVFPDRAEELLGD